MVEQTYTAMVPHKVPFTVQIPGKVSRRVPFPEEVTVMEPHVFHEEKQNQIPVHKQEKDVEYVDTEFCYIENMDGTGSPLVPFQIPNVIQQFDSARDGDRPDGDHIVGVPQVGDAADH